MASPPGNHGPPLSEEELNRDLGYQSLIASIVFLIANSAFLAAQFAAQRYRKAPFSVHDMLIIFSWVFIQGLCTANIVMLRFGSGHHEDWVYRYQRENLYHQYLLVNYAIPILWLISTTLPKLSMVVLYLKLFIGKPFRWTCYGVIGLLLINLVVNVLVTGFQCDRLPQPNETLNFQPTHCHNIRAHWAYVSIPNVVTDVIIMILPLPFVFKLHKCWQARAGILAIFLVGSGGLITSIIRFFSFYELLKGTPWPTYDGDSSVSMTIAIMTAVEPSIYFICACTMTCQPLVRKVVKSERLRSLTSWHRKDSKNSSKRVNNVEFHGSPELVPEENIDYENSMVIVRTQAKKGRIDWFDRMDMEDSQSSPTSTRLSSDHSSDSNRESGKHVEYFH